MKIVKKIYSQFKKLLGNSLLMFSILFLSLITVTFGSSQLHKMNIPSQYHKYLIQPASAHEIENDFLCPCCGEEVADCTCDMAKERRSFIEAMIDKGEEELFIYAAYAKEYDLSEFRDDKLSSVIQNYLIDTAPQERPQIIISEDHKDLGELIQEDYAQGDRLEMEFEVKNKGSKDLIINGIDSSCMCTKGQLINGEQISPELGMDHSEKQPEEWNVTIKPGETATLKVFYDPNVHGELSGDISRTVTLESNDPINSKISVKFDLTQI